MSKREVPKLNRDTFPTWKSMMTLNIGGLGDHAQSTIAIEHVDPIGVLTTEDLERKKENNRQYWRLSLS